MHSHGNVRCRSTCKIIAYMHFVESVSAFVDGREHSAFQIIFFVSGGDTHIFIMKICGKRMNAGFYHSSVKVKSDMLCQFSGNFSLFFHIVRKIIKIFINQVIIFHSPFYKRNNGCFQAGEKFIQYLGSKSFFVIIKKNVVKRSFVSPGLCLIRSKFLIIINNFL